MGLHIRNEKIGSESTPRPELVSMKDIYLHECDCMQKER